jgi:hypothetical protein
MSAVNSFPDHAIDPRDKQKGDKGRQWHLKMVKAAWNDCESGQPRTMFYHYASEYDKIKSYALGRQDTSPYKKPMHVDQQSNTTYAVLDFKVLPIVKKHRQIALGRLQKSNYNIVATAIDPAAKQEAEAYFAHAKAKIMMREAMMQQNPELANSPVLQQQEGEPLDLAEYEIQKNFGFQHNYCISLEEGIDLAFTSWNDIPQLRDKIFEDLFDWGVAAYKKEMTPQGRIFIRRCDARNMVVSACNEWDFSDAWYAGEKQDIPWSVFRERANGWFDEEEFTLIKDNAGKNIGTDRNTNYRRTSEDKFKVPVLDLYWLSEDEYAFEDRVNRVGNPVFGKTDYNAKNNVKEKIKRHKRVNVYHAKWIIGTDYIYDWGLMPFMERDKGLTNTRLPFLIVATNFHDGKASGIMEDIIPIADQLSIAWLKLQNIRNSLPPSIIEMDLDALEDVALSKGGDSMSPKDLIQMMFQNHILLSRRKGLSQNNPNYKTVDFIETNYGKAIGEAWQDFTNHIQLLRDVTGFNEVTDGSTPNPKNLNSTNAAAIESTNNALYHISGAEKKLLLDLARSVEKSLKRAVNMGRIEGMIRDLGKNTTRFIQVSAQIADHDYNIVLEDKPTPEQKAFLQQMMAKGMQEGSLDATDIIMVENTRNLKKAEQILAHRIEKRKQQQQQFAIQQSQQNAQVQMQSAQATAQIKMQELQLEYDLKLRNEIEVKKMDLEIEKLRLAAKDKMNVDNNKSKEKQNGMATEEAPSLPETPLPEAA